MDKIVAPNGKLDIQFNMNKGGFIINAGQQRIENTPTTPPPPVLGNNNNRTLEIQTHNNEEQIQDELNKVIENLMGKLAEEYVDEILIDTPTKLTENDNIPNIEQGQSIHKTPSLIGYPNEEAQEDITANFTNLEESPVVEGLNGNEERDFIIKELINM